jgi:hypothetical protein
LLRYVPGLVRDQLASYPEGFPCSLKESKPATSTVTAWQHVVLAFTQMLIMFVA